MSNATPTGPLAGLHIIEFAGIGPGPFVCMLLSDMGADVVTGPPVPPLRGCRSRSVTRGALFGSPTGLPARSVTSPAISGPAMPDPENPIASSEHARVMPDMALA